MQIIVRDNNVDQALRARQLDRLDAVAGSQARQEQTVKTDQDNAIIMSDEATDEDRKYFEELARFVSDGLALSGYPYCPGNVMATNEKWLQKYAVQPSALVFGDGARLGLRFLPFLRFFSIAVAKVSLE